VRTVPSLDTYAEIVGRERIQVMRRLADRLEGLRLVVVNSTRVGGGVAEILALSPGATASGTDVDMAGVEPRWITRVPGPLDSVPGPPAPSCSRMSASASKR